MHDPIHPLRQWGIFVSLLLFLFATRLHNLTALPLHNDEGLHITRALAVWDGHPFWNISDGKIINHWLIAAFYPQHAPDFVARLPTVFVALVGLAAGYALVRHWFGGAAAAWGGVMWITAPYLFFYERLAQSDPQAGALVLVAVWAAVLLAERGAVRWALLTGGALAAATLMKFTAAPFALTVLLVVVFVGGAPVWVRARHLGVIGAVGAALVAVPMIYLLLSGQPFFAIAMGWLGDGTSTGLWTANAGGFWAQLGGFGRLGGLWRVIFAAGLVVFVWRGGWRAARLLAFVSVPLLLIIALSSVVFPRHFVVTLPALLLLSGAGWGLLLRARYAAGMLAAVLVAGWVAFAWDAYTQPGRIHAPPLVRLEYVEAHSAGFALRDAAADIPALVPPGAPIVASMFPASCRRANLYLPPGYAMRCVDAPGTEAVQGALARHAAVYVLVEESPGIGDLPPGSHADLLHRYPRPGGVSSVALYRVYSAGFSPQ
jgi:4-amino-4-deoxy-L-arabinose transferase-like glycosyltransferase